MWEHPVSLLVVYAGFYLAIVFISLSIACGLYYLAELCEEYVLTTKRLIGHTIKAELLLHALLLYDRLPPLCLAAGVAAQLSYLRLLRPFPYVRLTSGSGLASIGLLTASTGLWLRHYWASNYTVEYISAFLLLTTWLVPFAFFLGISGDYTTLPGAGGFYPPPLATAGSGVLPPLSGPGSARGAQQQQQRKRRGLMLRIFDALRRKRDQVLPEIAKTMPDTTAFLKEKL